MTNVTAADGAAMSLRDARRAWEAGEFSDWVEEHGFPLTVGGETFAGWDGVGEALSDDSGDADDEAPHGSGICAVCGQPDCDIEHRIVWPSSR